MKKIARKILLVFLGVILLQGCISNTPKIKSNPVTDTTVSYKKTNDMHQLRYAAEQGDADAEVNLAEKLIAKKDFVKAEGWLRKAAMKGNAEAQAGLGLFYFSGLVLPQDFIKAEQWSRKSAEQGNASGQQLLGFAYFTGQGVKKDYAESERWFLKAAAQGDIQSQINLGHLYGDVALDTVEAYAWFEIAAERGGAIKAIQMKKELSKQLSQLQIKRGDERALELKRKHCLISSANEKNKMLARKLVASRHYGEILKESFIAIHEPESDKWAVALYLIDNDIQMKKLIEQFETRIANKSLEAFNPDELSLLVNFFESNDGQIITKKISKDFIQSTKQKTSANPSPVLQKRNLTRKDLEDVIEKWFKNPWLLNRWLSNYTESLIELNKDMKILKRSGYLGCKTGMISPDVTKYKVKVLITDQGIPADFFSRVSALWLKSIDSACTCTMDRAASNASDYLSIIKQLQDPDFIMESVEECGQINKNNFLENIWD